MQLKLLLIAIFTALSVPVYFIIARRFELLDYPNQRSSHTKVTYRGAGIIFLFAVVFYSFLNQVEMPFLLGSLFLASLTGFLDDLFDLKAIFRVLLYGTALVLGLAEIPDFLLDVNPIVIGICFVVGLGTVNAYNFMDGINGITTVYTLVLVFTSIFINYMILPDTLVPMIEPQLLYTILIACLVFGFLNFRKKARAFLGDVGSVFLGMLAVFLVIYFIYATGNISFLLLLLVYGVDTVLTIVERIRNKENIFEAHRKHLYQLLSNELKWPHLWVAILYGLIQLIINLLVLNHYPENPILVTVVVIIISGLAYLFIKSRVKQKIKKLHA
jgi:UDP-N-acetylmuramyl pentapeptide phosphotransferase/UDP-N-acetylglucosamine-1-phosphate transferase